MSADEATPAEHLLLRRLAVCDRCWEKHNPGFKASAAGWASALPGMRDDQTDVRSVGSAQLTCIECLEVPGTIWVRMIVEWP